MLSREEHDMRHSQASPLPQSWMSLDIKLGSLTVNMEEDKWLKGMVDQNKSNVISHLDGHTAANQANVAEQSQKLLNPVPAAANPASEARAAANED